MVRSMGERAYPYLCERAEMAKAAGDRDSAITWWDIALAVAEIANVKSLSAVVLCAGWCLT
jgi:hypothetical protein